MTHCMRILAYSPSLLFVNARAKLTPAIHGLLKLLKTSFAL